MSQIQVTSSLLKAKAEELNAQNAQLKTQIEHLEETEATLRSMYEGESSNAFHSAFTRDKTQMMNFYNAIQQYVQVLQNVAARYAKAESQNVELATVRKY